MDRGCSMKEDCTLHKILNAYNLNLLHNVPDGLLPCSVVNLSYMSCRCPKENKRVVKNVNKKLNAVQLSTFFISYLLQNSSWFLMVPWISKMKLMFQLKRNTRNRFPCDNITRRQAHGLKQLKIKVKTKLRNKSTSKYHSTHIIISNV